LRSIGAIVGFFLSWLREKKGEGDDAVGEWQWFGEERRRS